jgi:hypothetical protein
MVVYTTDGQIAVIPRVESLDETDFVNEIDQIDVY